MELEQLPQGHAFDGVKPLAVMILKEFLGVLRAKAPNHTPRILRIALYVKRSDLDIGINLKSILRLAAGSFLLAHVFSGFFPGITTPLLAFPQCPGQNEQPAAAHSDRKRCRKNYAQMTDS